MTNNATSRRALQRAPQPVQELLAQLPGEPQLVACQHGSMGWSARIAVAGRTLRLTYDRGYLAVHELVDGAEKLVSDVPEKDSRQMVNDVLAHLDRKRA